MDRSWRSGGAVRLRVGAPPALAYERVADVAAIGRRSEECRRAAWLPGVEPGRVGARFRGHNRSGVIRWSRVCEVVSADPGRRFAFRTVPERHDPTRADSTVWAYDIEADGDGSLVTHSYEIVRWPLPPLRWLYGWLLPQHRDMRPQMVHTLEALRAEFEAPPVEHRA